mmetsp:Transcript_8542/g.22855  ORF Transcript_8542/g.22855 Transcript_8542/m.22855 type:complete len:151 (+) Transcript_8542:652-1104(+)
MYAPVRPCMPTRMLAIVGPSVSSITAKQIASKRAKAGTTAASGSAAASNGGASHPQPHPTSHPSQGARKERGGQAAAKKKGEKKGYSKVVDNAADGSAIKRLAVLKDEMQRLHDDRQQLLKSAAPNSQDVNALKEKLERIKKEMEDIRQD